jgi:hypothetical protein
MSARTQSIDIRGESTTTHGVPAYIRDGLAVHRAVFPAAGWNVTHVASGLWVVKALESYVEAMSVRDELLALEGVDWMVDAEHLAGRGLGDRIRAILRNLGIPEWKRP